MSAPTAASVRARANVRKGKAAEASVARFLRAWWPNACRAVRTGSSAAADPGDIAGVPFIVSVKDVANQHWPRWWDELDAMLADDQAALGFIVEKRRGAADPALWWAHLYLDDLGAVLNGRRVDRRHNGTADRIGCGVGRVTLRDLVVVLAEDCGYAP